MEITGYFRLQQIQNNKHVITVSVSAFLSIRAPWANATSLGGPQHHRLTSVYNSESDQKKNCLNIIRKVWPNWVMLLYFKRPF